MFTHPLELVKIISQNIKLIFPLGNAPSDLMLASTFGEITLYVKSQLITREEAEDALYIYTFSSFYIFYHLRAYIFEFSQYSF